MSLFLIRYFFWLLQCLVTLGVVGRMVEQEGGAEIPNPRVLAQTKTNRPLVSPDTYSGDRNWTDWVEQFEAAALVNGWDEPTKLLWLPVRLTGKAQTAWRRLLPEAKQDFQAAKDALQKRFEPESKRQLYVVEFQTRKRRPDEQWSDFGDELRILADKAFPGIDEKLRICCLSRDISVSWIILRLLLLSDRDNRRLWTTRFRARWKWSRISIKRPKAPKYPSSVMSRSKNGKP